MIHSAYDVPRMRSLAPPAPQLYLPCGRVAEPAWRSYSIPVACSGLWRIWGMPSHPRTYITPDRSLGSTNVELDHQLPCEVSGFNGANRRGSPHPDVNFLATSVRERNFGPDCQLNRHSSAITTCMQR